MPGLTLTLTRDGITPSIARLSSPALRRRAVMAAGTVVQSLAQRAFDEPGLRPQSWPARKSGGGHALLILSGTMRQSIHVSPQGSDAVKVGTPVKYAAVHQLGAQILPKSGGRLVFKIGDRKIFAKQVNIPARPFFPVLNGSLTGTAAQSIGSALDILVRGAAG